MTTTDTIQAGRALDVRVAEHVLGMRWSDDGHGYASLAPEGSLWSFAAREDGRVRAAYLLPRYSTKLVDAWEVVEHLRRQGWRFRLQEMPPLSGEPGGRGFEAEFARHGAYRYAHADAVPEAICRAALAAMGVE